MCYDGHINEIKDWMKKMDMIRIECINVQLRN